MLGSLVPDEPDRWQAALDAYQQWRPLSDFELKLLAVFDDVNPTLAGLNWIRWLYIENRRFESIDVVQNRLAAIEQRL